MRNLVKVFSQNKVFFTSEHNVGIFNLLKKNSYLHKKKSTKKKALLA